MVRALRAVYDRRVNKTHLRTYELTRTGWVLALVSHMYCLDLAVVQQFDVEEERGIRIYCR